MNRTDLPRKHSVNAKRATRGLYAICFGFFLVLLDTTALNVALVAIGHELGSRTSSLQWVVNGYTVTLASMILVCGSIGDRCGARRVYQLGLFLFTAMSLLSALAPSLNFLMLMRIGQGIGAAMMVPSSLSLLTHAFPVADERAKAVAFWAGIVSLGFAAGPGLGGLMTQYLGWRSIFWLNVPVGLLALALVYLNVDETEVSGSRRIDWLGQTTAGLALILLTYGLIQAGDSGWTAAPVLGSLGMALFFAALFIAIERASEQPVLPPVLFAIPLFAVCIGIGFVLNFCVYGVLFIESLYLQNILNLDALGAGLVILPFTALPTITTRLIVRYSLPIYLKQRLIIGLLFASFGAAVLAGGLFDAANYGPILSGLGLLGVAQGFIMPAMTAGVLTSSTAQMSGVAAGILNSSRQVGGAIGVALLGTLVKAHAAQGYLWSFVIILITFFTTALATAIWIQPQRRLQPIL